MNYKIKSGTIGSNAVWSIIDETGTVLASAHGPMSGILCLAGVENLNKNFQYDGWAERLSKLTVNQPDSDA